VLYSQHLFLRVRKVVPFPWLTPPSGAFGSHGFKFPSDQPSPILAVVTPPSEYMVVAGGLGTGDLVIFSLWRCLRGDVVIKNPYDDDDRGDANETGVFISSIMVFIFRFFLTTWIWLYDINLQTQIKNLNNNIC
jgi:hypothetical protein